MPVRPAAAIAIPPRNRGSSARDERNLIVGIVRRQARRPDEQTRVFGEDRERRHQRLPAGRAHQVSQRRRRDRHQRIVERRDRVIGDHDAAQHGAANGEIDEGNHGEGHVVGQDPRPRRRRFAGRARHRKERVHHRRDHEQRHRAFLREQGQRERRQRAGAIAQRRDAAGRAAEQEQRAQEKARGQQFRPPRHAGDRFGVHGKHREQRGGNPRGGDGPADPPDQREEQRADDGVQRDVDRDESRRRQPVHGVFERVTREDERTIQRLRSLHAPVGRGKQRRHLRQRSDPLVVADQRHVVEHEPVAERVQVDEHGRRDDCEQRVRRRARSLRRLRRARLRLPRFAHPLKGYLRRAHHDGAGPLTARSTSASDSR